jgi:hypothetical protein
MIHKSNKGIGTGERNIQGGEEEKEEGMTNIPLLTFGGLMS